MSVSAHQALDRAFRSAYGQVLAALIRSLGSFERAEDALQDAMTAALSSWSQVGVPERPAAWLLTTARRRAIDRLRRDATAHRKAEGVALLERLRAEEREAMAQQEQDASDNSHIPDERLRLIFTCCHPALASEARIALTLRTLGGLTTPEIARAFVVPEATLAQRLVRAKKKIALAGIPYELPGREHWGARLRTVYAVVYLIFNEGYYASSGDAVIRHELCEEAIRLGRMLVLLLPESGEAKGLLALMVLHHARRRARVDDEGQLILLADQDRALWDVEAIAEGKALTESALTGAERGPYQIQAAIACVHCSAAQSDDTDWTQICLLYRALVKLTPTPVVELNWAVAVSFAEGPERGLSLLGAIDRGGRLVNYHPFYTARADMQRRAGRLEQAESDYRRAIELASNPASRALLRRRLAEI